MNLFKQRFKVLERRINFYIEYTKMTPVKTFNKTVELSAEGIQSRQDECAMR